MTAYDTQRPPESRGFGGRVVLAIVGLAVLGVGAWIVTFTLSDPESTGRLGARISAIASDPEQFYGERVAVTGNVGERFGSNALTIGADQLLVVRAGELPSDVAAGDLVLVLGEVRRLTSAEASDEFGAALGAELLRGLEERPAIFADDIVVETAPA